LFPRLVIKTRSIDLGLTCWALTGMPFSIFFMMRSTEKGVAMIGTGSDCANAVRVH
jgi:hypothetical protein